MSGIYAYRMSHPTTGRLIAPDLVKIGRSEINVVDRIFNQTCTAAVGYVPKVEQLLPTDHPDLYEKTLHTWFASRHVPQAMGNEWFRASKEEVAEAFSEVLNGINLRQVARRAAILSSKQAHAATNTNRSQPVEAEKKRARLMLKRVEKKVTSLAG